MMKLILNGKPLINGIISYMGKKRKTMLSEKEKKIRKITCAISCFVLTALKMDYTKRQVAKQPYFFILTNPTLAHTH